MKAQTQRKPFQPRFKSGLTQPLIPNHNRFEFSERVKLGHREHDTHFASMVHALAKNKKADSVISANVLRWQQANSDRQFNRR